MGYQEFTIEGRNAVIEAYRAGKPIDKLFILDGCQDGPMMTIKREAKKHDTLVKYVTKERLDQLSETGKHQGVIAYAAAYEYAEVDDILEAAKKKGEPPFIFLLDNIEDPHNLGAIIRTANLAGAHGVIIPKNRAECFPSGGDAVADQVFLLDLLRMLHCPRIILSRGIISCIFLHRL